MQSAQRWHSNRTITKAIKTMLMTKFTEEKLLSTVFLFNLSYFPTDCPMFTCLLHSASNLLLISRGMVVDAGMLCACMCVCVCLLHIPSVATPHLSVCISKSGSLINTYLCPCLETQYMPQG